MDRSKFSGLAESMAQFVKGGGGKEEDKKHDHTGRDGDMVHGTKEVDDMNGEGCVGGDEGGSGNDEASGVGEEMVEGMEAAHHPLSLDFPIILFLFNFA